MGYLLKNLSTYLVGCPVVEVVAIRSESMFNVVNEGPANENIGHEPLRGLKGDGGCFQVSENFGQHSND